MRVPSINAIAEFTGFDRGALTKRAKRLGLSGDINPKLLLQLIPLDEAQEGALDLQQERAKEARESARLKRLQADEKERKLADVDWLMEANNELLEGIAQNIKKSDLADDRKEDCLDAIAEHLRKWGEQYA